MSCPLAIVFEGMPLPPFLGIWLGLLMLVALLFMGYRRWREDELAGKPFWWTLAVLVLMVVSGGMGFWHARYATPLPLPAKARQVSIHRSGWLFGHRSEQMQFRLSESEFQRWVEGLCGARWESLADASPKVKFRVCKEGQFLPDPNVTDQPASKPAEAGRQNGYELESVGGQAFPGKIFYDTDQEIVSYDYQE